MQDAWLTVVITKNIKTKKLSNIEQLDYIISPHKIKIKNMEEKIAREFKKHLISIAILTYPLPLKFM